MNKTPIVGEIKGYKVHAATLRQVMRLAEASKGDNAEAQLEAAEAIIDGCVEGVESPAESLDAATANQVLQLATSGTAGSDPTKSTPAK